MSSTPDPRTPRPTATPAASTSDRPRPAGFIRLHQDVSPIGRMSPSTAAVRSGSAEAQADGAP